MDSFCRLPLPHPPVRRSTVALCARLAWFVQDEPALDAWLMIRERGEVDQRSQGLRQHEIIYRAGALRAARRRLSAIRRGQVGEHIAGLKRRDSPFRCSLAGAGIRFSESLHNERRCALLSLGGIVTNVFQQNPNYLAALNIIRFAVWLDESQTACINRSPRIHWTNHQSGREG